MLSEIGYISMLRLNAINGVRPVVTFLALMGGLFVLYAVAYRVVRSANRLCRSSLFVIGVGAVLFRLTLLPAGLPHDAGVYDLGNSLREDVTGTRVTYERFILFDSDHWRYLWDGHVWAHGVNPFQYAPSDVSLNHLAEGAMVETDDSSVWVDIRDNINYADVPTIYPPLAQVVFRLSHLLAPGSVAVLKSLMILLDLFTVLFVGLALKALNRPVTNVVLYAWNPLIIKVIAGSGHIDALLSALLGAMAFALICRKRIWAALTFGLALLSKLSPFILAPFVIRRIGWRYASLAAGIFILGYMPFLGAGGSVFEGLRTFGKEWQFNGGPFVLVQWLAGIFTDQPRFAANIVNGGLILAVLLWLVLRDAQKADFPAHAALAMGSLLILSPVVMPWYLTWVLPFAVMARQQSWIVFSWLVCLAFLVMIRGTESPWALFTEYGIFAILVWWEFRRISRSHLAFSKVSPASG